jgi:FkbM family methyltransferase
VSDGVVSVEGFDAKSSIREETKARKIFLDVGGYRGDSSRAALDPLFKFDKIYCFEPVAQCCEEIRANISDPRFTVINAGLLDVCETIPFANAGELGGSIYGDGAATVECRFIRASKFFLDHIGSGDRVWMKLNCEGAEVAILNDLLDSGEASKLREVLIDLDAAKFPHLVNEAEALLKRLRTAPFDYHYPPEVQYGMINNFGAIRNWLLVSGAATPTFLTRLASAVYQFPYLLDRRFNGYFKIRLLRTLGLRPPPEQVSPALRHTWSPIAQPRGPHYRDERNADPA